MAAHNKRDMPRCFPAGDCGRLARGGGEPARVRSGETGIAGALLAALGFEKAVLAAPFFNAARMRDPVARALLRAFRSSTVEHLERIRAAYEEEARPR